MNFKNKMLTNIPGFEKTKTMVVLCSLLHRVLYFHLVCFFFLLPLPSLMLSYYFSTLLVFLTLS
jgi:hypothetical protein